ncbi:prophage repressor protein [Francisella tularensis subsp. tularensis FSC033]|nr:prophage repressor protein [Francisella tularensis subsp. tularensis FSC033]MWZ50820.1 helix-turn-helix domain-containing protein [Francisella tularensis]ROZ68228.1 helix-turn-helix domain-containing protein [Francisella tularensis]ROZ71802.1 helix-turn-helix domain-containing protein [Francisella tularensis]ROZ74711.1 helix-turn-helix domain-containing protein [Francisella tularensis]
MLLEMFNYKTDLKPALKRIGMKQIELAKKLGKSDRTIKGWVAGTNCPSYDGHIEVMRILGLKDNYCPSDTSIITVTNVPVLSYVQAGEFTESQENIDPIDYLQIPDTLVPKNGFSLQVQGESMLYDFSESQLLNPKYSKYTIYEGENILVDPNQVNPQDLIDKVVVARNSDGATVKLLYKDNNRLYLMPLNSKLQNNDEIKSPADAVIIGRVVKSFNIRSF